MVFERVANGSSKAGAAVPGGVGYHQRRRFVMAIRTTRSAGMLLLALWLILTGLGGLVALPIPGVLRAAMALIAGSLILIGM
jgi:hypothetical protein